MGVGYVTAMIHGCESPDNSSAKPYWKFFFVNKAMSETFKYKGEPLGQELIASIAGLLSASTIPNVLWGNYMLIVHGVPPVVEVF